MADVGLKIVVGADISAVTDGMKVAANNIAQFGDVADKAFSEVSSKVGIAANSFEHAFDEIAAGNAALAKINASIEAAGDAAQQTGLKFDTLGGRLPLEDFNVFKKSIDQFKKDIASGFKFNFPPNPIPTAFPEALNKTKTVANQAAAALTNIGRVAQDLPFGFIGIQNNLNPLLESFQRLKAETGSGKAALTALGQSLVGPAGIGIALSVVSSAIVIFQNGIAGFNSKTKEAKEKADEFAKSIRDIGSIQREAAAGVQGQIDQVAALARVVSDSNKPYEQRKRALEELKDINKSYFGDLKLEDAATGALTKTVEEYTKALINNAIQKGFVDEIASVAKAVAKQDDVIAASKLKLAQAQREANAAQQRTKESFTEEQISANAAIASTALSKEKDALEGVRLENSKVTELLAQEAKLRDQLNRAVEEGLKFKDLDTKGNKKEEDILKKRLGALEKIKSATKDATALVGLQESIFELQVKIAVRDQGKNQLTNAELKQQIKGFQNELNDAFKKQAIELEAIPKVKVSDVVLAEVSFKDIESKIAKATGLDKKIPVITLHEARVKILGSKLTAEIEEKEKIIEDLKKQIAGIFEGGLGDVFAGLGEGFGEVIASADFGGALKKAAQNIIGIVGNVMQQLGRALVAAAIKIKLLKETFEKWAIANPALAIIAGIGLIAAGAALKNIKFDGPKFAEGGIVSGPMIGQVGERFRPEVVLPLDRLPQLFKQIGGDVGGGTQLIPIINNEGLYLAMKRGERSAGRKF